MPLLTITKTYLNGNILTETDLDNAFNSISTLLNTTLLDSSNIQTSGIIGANLANGIITNAKLGALAVDTGQIASSAVTKVKLATQNYALSATCDNFSVTGGTQDVTNLTVTLANEGRPVRVEFQSDGQGFNSAISMQSASCALVLYKNAEEIARWGPTLVSVGTSDLAILPSHTDVGATVASSAYTYHVVAVANVANTTAVRYMKLLAYPL